MIEVEIVHFVGGVNLERLATLAGTCALLVLDDIHQHLTGHLVTVVTGLKLAIGRQSDPLFLGKIDDLLWLQADRGIDIVVYCLFIVD